MCRGEDLNLHGLPRLLLRQVRLPISPPRHILVKTSISCRVFLVYSIRACYTRFVKNTKKCIKKLPIETFVLGIPCLFFLILFYIYRILHPEVFAHITPTSPVRFVVGFGSGTFEWLLLFVCMYVGAKGIRYLYLRNKGYSFDNNKIISYGKKGFYGLALLTLVGTTTKFIINTIFITAEPSHIITVSDSLLKIDQFFLSTFPALYLYQILSGGVVEKLIVYSYTYLSVILAVIFFVVLLKNRYLFRLFFLSFIIAFSIASPLWLFFPALSPQEMYRTNVLDRQIPQDIIQENKELTNSMSPFIKNYLYKFDRIWISEDKSFYAVSSFPSLHVAWGIIGTVIGIALWPALAWILVPWCIFNFIGTFYLLQHYVVDSFAGIIVAVISLSISYMILRLEKKLRS